MELSLDTPEEIKTTLVVMDYKRITIRKGGEEIQTFTYILIFNQ